MRSVHSRAHKRRSERMRAFFFFFLFFLPPFIGGDGEDGKPRTALRAHARRPLHSCSFFFFFLLFFPLTPGCSETECGVCGLPRKIFVTA